MHVARRYSVFESPHCQSGYIQTSCRLVQIYVDYSVLHSYVGVLMQELVKLSSGERRV